MFKYKHNKSVTGATGTNDKNNACPKTVHSSMLKYTSCIHYNMSKLNNQSQD